MRFELLVYLENNSFPYINVMELATNLRMRIYFHRPTNAMQPSVLRFRLLFFLGRRHVWLSDAPFFR
ncbi:hypothetical protein VNO77_00750 [Canavalia gladiata]|uniref:Uncharacterized protein n=1 Tax=Canavalia gladiata TaxID=3824 RepID=A0AAN9MRS4_CANGL